MHIASSSLTGSGAQSGVRWLLRAEGLALLLMATAAYARWAHWAGAGLRPDLAVIGYAAGPRVGALCYNATHSTLGLAALLAFALVQGHALCMSLAFIWFAHMGFDRALGSGLKYSQGLGFTHLGRIGKQAS